MADRRRLHPAHRSRLEREEARHALTECAMPLCSSPPIRHDERGRLGICAYCALDVADYFAKLEEVPALTERQLQRRLRIEAQERRRDAEAESRAITPGWVYYVRVTDRIKIGYSEDVRQRMRAYPPHAELLAVHPGTPTLEREMHAKFSANLAQGREWFRPDPEVMEHVAMVLAEFGPPPKSMIYTFRERSPQQMRPRGRARRVG